jgi:hypothetical protein
MPTPSFPDPMHAKVLLALVSALLGWAIKAAWEELQLRLRWRRLAPLILRQLGATARECAQAFDVGRLPHMEKKLAAAQASAVELVAAGVRVKDWLDALLHLSNTMDALQAVEAAPAAQKGEALEGLRIKGQALLEWAEEMGRSGAALPRQRPVG